MPAIRSIAKAIGTSRPALAHDDLTALVEVL
jgi:hypothetical protein